MFSGHRRKSLAARIISQLPKDDLFVDKVLHKSEALKAIHEVICSMDGGHNGMRTRACQDASLLEIALAALLHLTDPIKPELQRQVGKLEVYTSLIRVLSTGSSLAKQRATSVSVSNATLTAKQTKTLMPMFHMTKLLPSMSWCCSPWRDHQSSCSVHSTACSPRETFCLVKAQMR